MMDYDRFMGEALKEARKAFARGEFPVGCVMVSRNRVIARGSRKGTAEGGGNELDHAEMVALRRWARPSRSAANAGAGITVFCTLEPCLMCFSALILHGVDEVVYAYEDAMGGGTGCDRSGLSPLYRESPIRLRPGVRRDESLALFKAYFADPANRYWQRSYLARYTLSR